MSLRNIAADIIKEGSSEFCERRGWIVTFKFKDGGYVRGFGATEFEAFENAVDGRRRVRAMRRDRGSKPEGRQP